MAQLQAAKKGEEPLPEERCCGDTADDQTLQTAQSHSSLPSSPKSGRSSVIVCNDSAKRVDGKRQSAASEDSSGVHRAVRGARVHPINPSSAQVLDRFRRVCTFMFVRFQLVSSDPEEDKLGQVATTVAAHVVMLAKAHGATIDKVTYDSVALHWNVSTQSTGAPLQATALAMEVASTRQVLPLQVQGELRLLVGIGHGLCTVATVSAAGQRFFVVGGAEVTNTVEVVMREAAVPLGCSILLSNAVQQEVHYSFRCSPRLWYRDVLFWEPVEKRGGCKVDDEWMYQIQHMEEDDTTLDVGRAMHDVFQLARIGQSVDVLQHELLHVRQTFSAHLTPQDLASLCHLQSFSVTSR
eukprot:GGOE01008279.1.p1 GENE.GGOE01008279.1~~GGOE01008279.1.p1  ORF type:complete len:360 (-),score=94.15 GGOE01008279.1:1401-2459(-)